MKNPYKVPLKKGEKNHHDHRNFATQWHHINLPQQIYQLTNTIAFSANNSSYAFCSFSINSSDVLRLAAKYGTAVKVDLNLVDYKTGTFGKAQLAEMEKGMDHLRQND